MVTGDLREDDLGDMLAGHFLSPAEWVRRLRSAAWRVLRRPIALARYRISREELA
jgi:hypothetical protein